MSQSHDTDSLKPITEGGIISVQPVAGSTNIAAPAAPAPASSGGVRGCLSAIWHAITPCVAAAVDIGILALQANVIGHLANNKNLTPEQKAIIVDAVVAVVQTQGSITLKALGQLIDHVAVQVVLADAIKKTASNIADASQKLLVVGSQELNELIDAKLQVKLEHAGITPDAAAKLTQTIKSSVATQKSITEKAIEDIINSNVTAFVAAQHFASETARNAATVAVEMVKIASEEGQHLIAQKLAGKFEHLGFTEQEAAKLTQSINAALATQTDLTVDVIDKIMNQQIGVFNAAKFYAANTAITVASATEKFINVADDAVLVVLRAKVDGAFKNMDPVLGKAMADALMKTIAADTNLTVAEFSKLIASYTAMAAHVAETSAATDVFHGAIDGAVANDNNHVDLGVTGADAALPSVDAVA